MMNSLLIGFIAGAGLIGIVALVLNLVRRIRELESMVPRRHTHNTINGLMDSSALLVDLVVRNEIQSEVNRNIIKRVIQKLGQVSEDPYAYQEGSSEREALIEEAVERFKKEMGS